jgi:hypothetical protein
MEDSMTIVSSVFKNRASADQAITELETTGITANQISLVLTDDARGQHFNLRESSKVDEGVAAGASLGGLLGVIAGAVLAAGTIAIPGVNVIVTGAVVSGLAGLGAGAVGGGLLGGLVGSGIPEHEAKLYDQQIRAGNVLLAVKARDHEQAKTVRTIFDRYNDTRAAA